MEDIEKLIEALRKAYNFQDWPIIASHATIVDRKTVHAAADAMERLNKFEGSQIEKLMEENARLLAENERLRSTCYPRDGVEAIIRERDAYKEELSESQREKQAAVRDLCNCCKTYADFDGCKTDCANCDTWRGPQEAGTVKGEK